MMQWNRLPSEALTAVGLLLLISPLFADPVTSPTLRTIRDSANVDAERRSTMLTPLLHQSAHKNLAHWHLAQIRSDESWLSIDEYTKRRADDPQLHEYFARRAEVDKGHRSELQLAGWCRKQGMYDGERVHLLHVVRSPRASNADRVRALQRLGLKVYQGRLRTQSQVNLIEERLEQERRDEAKWRPILQRWVEAIEDGSARKQRYALTQLRNVTDPGAILTLEKLLSHRSERFAREFVSIAGAISTANSTESLVRQSVDSPWKSVRESSASALKERPLHDHTPHLLGELNSPVESRFRVGIDADGMVRRAHQIYSEGQDAKHLATFTNARGPERVNRAVAFVHPSGGVAVAPVEQAPRGRPRIRGRAADYSEQEIAEWAAQRERQKRLAFARQVIAQQEAVKALQVQAELSVMNAQIEKRNQRVFAALAETTGETTIPSASLAWWDWWDEYNDRYRGQKPTYTHVSGRSDPMQVSYVPLDCFPEGTLVHTEVGARTIESVRAGDRVLSQNVDTGELAYKIVLRRTIRPPSDLLDVHFADGETIRTTKGHPFWVNNIGWRMAKQLSEAHYVYSAFSNAKVARIEPHAEKLSAINLVVNDFGTFFVGKQGLLVHGTPRRRPTTALVPGVLAEQLESE